MPTLLPLLLLAVPQVSGGGFDQAQLHLGDAAGDLMGATLGSLPDVDGDGVADLLGGAWAADVNGMTNAGMLRLWSGATGSQLWQVEGGVSFEQLGLAAVAVADMNADGLADVAVGTSLGSGEVQLRSGLDGSLIRILTSPLGADDFGEALAAAGDLNADGVEDLFVGAGDTDGNGILDSGMVYAISGLDGSVLWSVSGEARLDHFGRTILAVPDRNGDGFPECLAAAALADVNGLQDVGVVRLLSGADGSELTRFQGGAFRAEFGSSLGLAGDHDGDGVIDLIIGAPHEQPAQTPEVGAASVYSGATDLLIRRYAGDVAYEWMGASVGSAGDLDGDGTDEVLIGANGAFYGGRVYVFSGRNGRRLWITESDGFGSDFAANVHGLGDYDQDGDLDYLVGAPHRRDQGLDKGAVTLWSFSPFLSADAASISDAVGGVIRLFVDFPAHSWIFDSNVSYWTLASLAGTGPSILMGWEVPLGSDNAYADTLAGNWPNVMHQPTGRLDSQGDAIVTLDVPPGTLTGLIGRQLHFAVVHFEGGGANALVHGSSRVAIIDILP